MGYGMKYTNGGFPFKASPAKQKENTTPHFLEKKPNPKVKAINRNTASTDETPNANNKNFNGHMEMRINKANDLKKYTQDQKEDVAAVGGGGNRKVMKDGPKNNAIYKGKPVKGDFTPHQFQ